MTTENNAEDLSLCVFPPNKPLEAVIDFSTTPCVYNNLLFLDFNKKGECILGSSNICATFWEGTLLFCKDAEKLQEFNHSAHYIYVTASDGKFLNETTIALAEDTGVLSILSLEDEKLKPIKYYRHTHRIPEIAVWPDSSKILSCSGRSAVIWDVDILERKPYIKHDNYHLSAINSVDVVEGDLNLFATAASDRKSCIWDMRIETPASVLYSNEFSSIQNIKWNQINPNYLIAGTKAGDVYLLDKREPKEFVSVQHCYDSSVHRIALNNANKVAVCGDSNDVVTIKCDSGTLDKVTRNSVHTSYVRGLKWHDNCLYSCGFDKKVIKH